MKLNLPRRLTSLLFCLLISSLLMGGCTTQQANSSDTPKNPAPTQTQTPITPSENKMTKESSLPHLEGKAIVEFIVNGSPIKIEVNGDDAPITAGNFVDLVERGFYNGLTFHRVIKSPSPFVAQGGDPLGNGTGGFVDPQTSQERRIPLEIKLKDEEKPVYGKSLGQQAGFSATPVLLKHTRGAIAMARSQAPNSASSQFYFALADLEFLDGDYAVFGYVTEGMNVVDGIKQGDRITSAKVIEGLEKLKK
jgi:peptidyl-prolyl cis-trans isomerase B (cyclophilin B)